MKNHSLEELSLPILLQHLLKGIGSDSFQLRTGVLPGKANDCKLTMLLCLWT